MKKKTTTTLWGIFLVGLGIAITGNMFGFWSLDLFRGWWTLLIIIPSIISIIERGFHTANVIGVLVGAALLLSIRDIVHIDSWGRLILPILLIAVGIMVLSRNNQ